MHEIEKIGDFALDSRLGGWHKDDRLRRENIRMAFNEDLQTHIVRVQVSYVQATPLIRQAAVKAPGWPPASRDALWLQAG